MGLGLAPAWAAWVSAQGPAWALELESEPALDLGLAQGLAQPAAESV